MLQQPSQVAPGSPVGASAFLSVVSSGSQQLSHVAAGSAVAGSVISSMASLGSNAQNTTSISRVPEPLTVTPVIAVFGSTPSSMRSSGCDETPVMQQPSFLN
jgi:hypothetical protein